ncbi:MAG: PEP-CTERM sorting domain-containing protein [Chlorobiaceae bacterium]|nr:PEP-CTERM sorting domain-containing protein [Chlorobiaceae bacterium]
MKTSTSSSLELKKAVRIGLLGLLFSMVPVLQANAVNPLRITDLNNTDANTIISQSNPSPNLLVVSEDYNESYLTPYSSFGGYAVVNASEQYFDKVLNFIHIAPETSVTLQFLVTNTTPYTWSDYHIEFWDSTFTSRLTGINILGYSTNQFDNGNESNGVISFWYPGAHVGAPVEEVGEYMVHVDLYGVYGATDGAIGIRQVATVPEPGMFALLSFGLAGLLGYRRSKAVA